MIYTVTKNGHTSTLIVGFGDLKAKRKLSNYHRRGWQVSAVEQLDPAPKRITAKSQVLPKNKKKEESLIKILRYWVGD